MSNVQDFLKKSQGLLGETAEADINALKETLKSLRKVSPDLIDAKIFERLTRLVDSVQIAKDTQNQVNVLASNIKKLEGEATVLKEKMQAMKQSFGELDRRLTFEAESQNHRNKKLATVLDQLEQYLRRHS